MATQQVASVTCPSCAVRFNAPIENIINGQDLSLKSAFLQNRLNVIRCPQCGRVNPLSIPLLYYDLEKELAHVFLPNGLQMTTADQERIIGSLTNGLVNTMPQEQLKFYLLNPKPFLSMESMIKSILEADGITKEMFEAQKAKITLLEEFLKMSDEASLKAKVKDNDHLLDREFFEILTASMQAAQYEGNQAGAQALFALRAFLAQESSQGEQAVAAIDQELGIVYLKNASDLLNKLQNAKSDEEFEHWVANGHQLLDYQFFQTLTEQIDAAAQAKDKAKEKELKALRTKILDTKGRQEEESQAALQKSAALLQEILRSETPQITLEENLEELDETFFALLSANIQEARRRKQNEIGDAMEMLGNMAISMLQERMAAQTEADEPAPKPPTSSIYIA
jgi:hypothetical protein